MRRVFLVLLALFAALLLAGLVFYARSVTTRRVVGGLVGDTGDSLNSNSGVTNLLFLGIAGEGHAAPDLTDSMIFVSLRHTNHTVRLISLPRDIWVDSMRAKLNTAYHYGNKSRESGGRDLAKSAVSEILGQPVHYALALDFAGFVRAVDAVGGLDVEIERGFDDYKYPLPGQENAEPESARYEHLHFEPGLTHLDGAAALKFARSRNSEGEEGTDFARSRRQQQILSAFADKIVSSETLFNLDKLQEIVNNLRSSIDTDIGDGEFAALFKFFLYSQDQGSIRSLDITSLFINPRDPAPYQGQWVLIPDVGEGDVHTYVDQNLAE